jgi:hypothetical protein
VSLVDELWPWVLHPEPEPEPDPEPTNIRTVDAEDVRLMIEGRNEVDAWLRSLPRP